MINYTMAREHFLDMGEQVHKHIYDLNLAWGQFLDFYSDLNNARKAHEDNFVEKEYIGEELTEPDEKPVVNNLDLCDNFEERHDQPNTDYFEAFDDGFDSISNRSSTAGGSVSTKPASTSQNMLGELQREISEEEAAATAPDKSTDSKVKGELLLEDQVQEPGDVI